MERIAFQFEVSPSRYCPHSQRQPQLVKVTKHVVSRLAVDLLIALGITVTYPGSLLAQQERGSDNGLRLGLYSSWLNGLFPEYEVSRGNIFLMTATTIYFYIR
jgi:hypothetical protein